MLRLSCDVDAALDSAVQMSAVSSTDQLYGAAACLRWQMVTPSYRDLPSPGDTRQGI